MKHTLANDKVIVIGGGVSGVTTALTLQLLGIDTVIYTEKTFSSVTDKRSSPDFASLFPSASVIPHSVYSKKLKNLFKLSQTFFFELRKLVFPGLTLHKHYEIFEFRKEPPDYCHWMPDFKLIDDWEKKGIPRRPNNRNLNGWSFDCIFADWPLYFSALNNIYRKSGGTIKKRKVERDDIPKLPSEKVINCSGTGAPQLFDDPSEEQILLRGHLLHKPDAPLITNNDDEIVSYNYTPWPADYTDSEGEACDVYCYPRKDGWIVGGSRQPGQLQNNQWEGHKIAPRNYEVDNVSFPRQIIDLNNEILETAFGFTIKRSDTLTVSVGYRYIRNRRDGLRLLDREEISGKTIFHNYGHGGSGVTLSWGCALTIAKEIVTVEYPELQRHLLSAFKEYI